MSDNDDDDEIADIIAEGLDNAIAVLREWCLAGRNLSHTIAEDTGSIETTLMVLGASVAEAIRMFEAQVPNGGDEMLESWIVCLRRSCTKNASGPFDA